MTWRAVIDLDALAVGVSRGVRTADLDLCLVRTVDDVYAVRDECTHGAVGLSEGEADGGAIECWMHGSRFDLRTGRALNPPATEPVRTFPVRVRGTGVEVDLPWHRPADDSNHQPKGTPSTPSRHSLHALEDSAVLLTVAQTLEPSSAPPA